MLVFAAGCEEPERPKTQTTNSKNYTVDVLFTDADGFTVKRFHDGGRDHYYVIGAAMGTESTQRAGKISYPEQIPTAQK